jgi:dihydrofolate reductase
MAHGRKVVYYCAVSADGFIARKDGSVDWLESRGAEDYGIAEFLQGIDTIVWGRTTFEGYGMKPPGLEPFGQGMRHIVLSHRPPPAGADPRAEFTAQPPAELARRLRAARGKGVWLMGGGASAAGFLDAGEVDELFVHVIPVLLGDGIPLFAAKPRDVPLELLESKAFPDGVVRLRYGIRRPASR